MNDPDIATHEDPAWRERANYILQADLTDHGMPGLFEQLWARDLGGGRFELCCLPFFTYGYALGDIVVLRTGVGRFAEVLGPVRTGSGRGLLRIYLTDRSATHEELHGAVAASGRPHEWRAGGLVAVDIERAIPDVHRGDRPTGRERGCSMGVGEDTDRVTFPRTIRSQLHRWR